MTEAGNKVSSLTGLTPDQARTLLGDLVLKGTLTAEDRDAVLGAGVDKAVQVSATAKGGGVVVLSLLRLYLCQHLVIVSMAQTLVIVVLTVIVLPACFSTEFVLMI